MAMHEADKAVAKAKAEGAKDQLKKRAKAGNASDDVLRELALQSVAGEDLAAPTCRRHIVNDATVEALGMRLAENPDGLLLHRDELTGFFRTLEKQGHESDRAFYLESWNGIGGYAYDRVGRGTLFMPSKCVSLFGTIQPGPLAAYLRTGVAGERADGFASRLQVLVYPDPPGAFVNVDRWPNTDAKNAAFAAFERLAHLDPAKVGAESKDDDGIPSLRFDFAAQAFFDAWRTTLENRLAASDESPLLIEHLSKYRSLLPSLALLFHLTDNEAGGPVTLPAIDLSPCRPSSGRRPGANTSKRTRAVCIRP
jgi:putative DNA primase/helicase